MSLSVPHRGIEGGASRLRGWAAAGLLALEYLVLTVLIDAAALGSASRLLPVLRMLSPALVGAGAAGLLIARHGPRSGTRRAVERGEGLPLAALGAQLLAFTVTATAGYRLMGPGAPAVAPAAFAAWVACAALTVLLAVRIVAPPLALLRAAFHHARVPLVAIALGLLSWRAVAAAEGAWGWLRGGTLTAVAALLGALSRDVVVLPAESVLGLGAFEVEIRSFCSGVDGLGLVLVFQAVWLSLGRARIRFGRALLVLVPLGVAAALAANVLRIAALVLLGASGREDLALGAFHSKLGWILFVGIALGTVAIAEKLTWLRLPEDPDAPEDAGLPPATTAYLAPLLAALATALVTSLWSRGGFDPFYGARVGAGALVLLLLRRSLPRPSLSLAWVPIVLGGAVCAFWVALAGGDGASLLAGLAQLAPAERTAWIALRLVGACLVLPTIEEVAFRGFLLPWLIAPDIEALPPRAWTGPAVAVSSLAFGALHEQWLLGAAAGVVFAAARLWRGRLGDAIVAHVACNVGVSLAVLAGGRWDLWA